MAIPSGRCLQDCDKSPNPGPTPFSSPVVFPINTTSKEFKQLQLNSSPSDATVSILDRVRRFLPEIQAANERLNVSDVMELPEGGLDEEPAIDMDLLVGVFDCKEQSNVQTRTDQLLGLRRSNRRMPGIEEIGSQ